MFSEEIQLGIKTEELLFPWIERVTTSWYAELSSFHKLYLGEIESEDTCPVSVQRVWMDGRKRSVQQRSPDCQERRDEGAH